MSYAATAVTDYAPELLEAIYPRRRDFSIKPRSLSEIGVDEIYRLNKCRLLRLVDIPEYNVWRTMKARCYNQNREGYHHYGARGIRVHEPWCDDFWAWFEYMGRRPELSVPIALVADFSIDRYPDKDGNYEPGNVRWATWDEQINNRNGYDQTGENNPGAKLIREQARTIKALAQRGILTLQQIADVFNVNPSTVFRIKRGHCWPNLEPEDIAIALEKYLAFRRSTLPTITFDRRL